MIRQTTDDIIPSMNHAMRTALAARAYGITLAHPRLAEFADRRSTQLSSYLQTPDKKDTKVSRLNIHAMISKALDARLPSELADLRTYLMAKTTECLLLDNKKWLMQTETHNCCASWRMKEIINHERQQHKICDDSRGTTPPHGRMDA